eukprot:COSAG03_NODE_22404_length_291_cov_1.067708_1_plen_40_part_10
MPLAPEGNAGTDLIVSEPRYTAIQLNRLAAHMRMHSEGRA